MFYVKILVVCLCVVAFVHVETETSQFFRPLCNMRQIDQFHINNSSKNTMLVQHNMSKLSHSKQTVRTLDAKLLQNSSLGGNDGRNMLRLFGYEYDGPAIHNFTSIESNTRLDQGITNLMLNTEPYSSKESIPFYLYPLEHFTSTMRCDTINFTRKYPKHAHIAFAFKAMQKHPWRIDNMTKARVAVLPLPFDAFARGQCTVNFNEMIVDMVSVLKNVTFFSKTRHVVIVNDFMSTPYHTEIKKRLWPSGILVGMEGRGECRTSLGYTSNYASLGISIPSISKQPCDRKYSVNMIGQVDTRWGYRDRRALFESIGSIPGSYIAVSDGYGIFNSKTYHKQSTSDRIFRNNVRKCTSDTDRDRCVVVKPSILDRKQVTDVMQNSNFTLCLRGDTLGSDRWINAMVSGTALITVGTSVADLNWLPFPDVVPWKEMVIIIPRAEFYRDPVASLRKIIQGTSLRRLAELQNMSRYYADDLEWSGSNSRVVNNLLKETTTISCKSHANYLRTHMSN